MTFGGKCRAGCLVAGVVLLSLSGIHGSRVHAVEIGGAGIVEYAEAQGSVSNGLIANTEHGRIRFVQGTLTFSDQWSNDFRGFTRVNVAGNGLSISEAWVAYDGLPYDGTLTIGQFYKPQGEPLLTATLTFPALLYHTPTWKGVKADFERGAWTWEAGVVDNNPLSAAGTVIGNTFAFSRPNPNANLQDNAFDVYGHLGWRAGGEWGSLVLGGEYTYGRMTRADRDLIKAMGIVNERGSKNRHVASALADYTYGPFRLFGEYVSAVEGDLRLTTYNISGAYRWGKAEFLLGYDRLKNNNLVMPFNLQASWERKRWQLGGTYEYTPNIQIQALYEFNRETISTLAVPDEGIPNDQFILQTVVAF